MANRAVLHKGEKGHAHGPGRLSPAQGAFGGSGSPSKRKGAATAGSADNGGRPRLERGAGEGKTLFFDAQSGAAGDMIVAALLDLGVPFEVVNDAFGALGLKGASVRVSAEYAGAIGVSAFHVEQTEAQPERSFDEIELLLTNSPLKSEVREHARAIFRRLAEAEAEVHRVPLNEVHFHEVGAVDALADIVGAAACLEYLGATLLVSPLPLGHGTVLCRHGRLPLPAPAAVLCLRGVPTYAAGIEAELVTPTGAAIIGAMATGFSRWPAMSTECVGWGKGTRELPDRVNALRVVLGVDAEQQLAPVAAVAATTHTVVEANIDDMSGELAAHVTARLLGAGALDAWLTPIIMKKGRPGLVLSALARASQADELAQVLLRESTTIGVRFYGVSRSEQARKTIRVVTAYGEVGIKLSSGPSGAAHYKPEFDECVELARAQNVTVREVIRAALAALPKP